MQAKIARTVLFVVIGLTLITTAGYYREATSPKEMPGFRVNLNSSSQETAKSWPMVVDVADLGLFKKILNPWTIHIRADSLTNEGKDPLKLRFSLVDNPLPVTWDSRQLAWNGETNTLARPFQPRESMKYALSLYFHIPPEYRQQPVIYNGGLKINDADTGRLLAFVPIKITNSKPSTGGVLASDGRGVSKP